MIYNIYIRSIQKKGVNLMNITRGIRGKLFDRFSPEMPLTVTMRANGPAVYDYSCFGVNEENRLSDERYMIFYNQTTSPNNEINYRLDNGTAVFDVSLTKLPNTIQKLVFTASIDGEGTMGQLTGFEVTIGQNGCEPLLLSMTGADFSAERAIISIEVYLKNEWRYSAVAMGFNGGLSDLLEYYGGEEESDDDDIPQQNNAVSEKAPADYMPELSDMPYQPPVNNFQPVQQPAYVPPQNSAPVPPPSAPSGKVSLKKLDPAKPISLKKDEKVQLRKETEFIDEPVTDFLVGLGWDPAISGTRIDCDSSVFLCKGDKLDTSNDIVAYYNKRHFTGAVVHHGDNLTGNGDGDDEQIEIHLNKLPFEYDKIVIVVNVFMSKVSGIHFGKIRNCYMRICELYNMGPELCRYTLSDNPEYDKMSAMILGEFTRINGIWVFHALGQGTKDGSIEKLAKRYKKGKI